LEQHARRAARDTVRFGLNAADNSANVAEQLRADEVFLGAGHYGN
jgi:hypothetical protein